MTEYKIETKEAIALMVNLLCNKFFVLAPLYMKLSAGNALLIMTIVSFIIAFIVWQIYARLSKSSSDLLDLIKNKVMKLALGSVIVITLTIVTILTLRQYGEGIKVMTLQKSPMYFIVGVFAIAMIIGAICGLKSLSKACGFFIPIIYFLAVALIVATVKQNDVYNFFPVLGNGLSSIISKGIIMLSMLFELIILLFLPSLLRKEKDFKKVGNHTFFWTFICFATIGGIYAISSSEQVIQTYEPFFRMIKHIEVGNLLQRCDSVFLILYCISAFLYLSTMLFFITYIASKAFEITDRKALITPIGLIITSVATVDILEEYMFSIIEKANYFLWIIAFALPLTILCANKLRFIK